MNNQNDSSKYTRFVGAFDDNQTSFSGTIVDESGNESSFTAIKKSDKKKASKKKNSKSTTPMVVPVTYPNVGYGFASKPKQETILFKNATVWTGEKEGILKNTDVLLKDGKIAQIGTKLRARGARVVDATGCERFAEMAFDEAERIVNDISNGRCWVQKVTVKEHDANSATCELADTQKIRFTMNPENNEER